MSLLRACRKLWLSLPVLACACLLPAQTYKVNSGAPPPSQTNGQQNQAPQKTLGWGSNIQNARLGHAAEAALRSGNYSAAADYAQRAVDGAPNDPQLWFLLGYCARLAGRLQVSLDAYNKGLRLNPSSLDGLSGLAQTDRTLGRNDEAQRLLSQVVSADPKRTSDSILLGELLMQRGDFERALAMLGRTEQLQPNVRAELLMALIYQRTHQTEKANQYLALAKRRSPNNPEVERALAAFYRDSGNYAAAISALEAIPHKPPDVKAELGYTYQLAGNDQQAEKLYVQAASAAPDNVDFQLSAAQAELSLGAVEKAQPLLDRAAALNPGHYRLHAMRGEIARLEDRDADALREYTLALDHLPQAPPEGPLYPIHLHVDLAELDQRLENPNAAKEQLAVARSAIDTLNGTSVHRAEFLRLRALIEMISGDFTGATRDLHEALGINAKDLATLQLQGDLLTKQGQRPAALAVYRSMLALDANNRFALTSAGYLSRELGRDRDAEKYFERLAATHPTLYVPYLALGDLYTSRREFQKAQAAYLKASEIAPTNSLVVAGGINAAIEAHTLPVAAEWLKRASPEMQNAPLVLRESERYWSWVGQYDKSAEIGKRALEKLPNDRDVVVYFGYDLLHLERWDELSSFAKHYWTILPQEPDIPLLAGYADKHAKQLEQAEQDFSEALRRDSRVPTAYVNRGFIRNDLHQPAAAATDFESALRFEPGNAEAHLGLAFASLPLHRPKVALREAQLAEQGLGDSGSIHLIRATAYGQQGTLARAAREYRLALKFSPNDASLHMALADSLAGMRHYREAISELTIAERLSAASPLIYSKLARCYALLGDRTNAMHFVQLTEQTENSDAWLASGEALEILGEHAAAMQRFGRALEMPDSDRVAVRLAIARHMSDQGDWDGARRQVALAFMEARVGDALPPTPEEFMQAGDVFLGIHDYPLAETYFRRALAAGASEASARIGLANTYLALGDTLRARTEISSVSRLVEEPDYQYLLAKATMLRQQHQNAQALTAFAQAAEAAGEDETAQRELLEVGGDEGLRVNRRLSFLSNFSVAPIFEDTTVYPMDAKLDVTHPLPGRQALLPLPRSSLETQWTGAYHLHLNGMPEAGGFFQIRNARGQISLPSADAVVNRNTTDYAFNFSVDPTVHVGNNVITFSTGIQETIRRDSEDPRDMNQNLIREFLYISTSSFFNIISVKGFAAHETGPFTLSNLHSRDLIGQLDFRVGSPWAKTALVTGYGARDLQFSPTIREFYYTSAYAGVERRISPRLSFRAVAEDLRAWRVDFTRFAIAQALRPAGSVEFKPTENWSIQATAAYSRNMGFHAYDAVQSGFAVSYAMPFQRSFHEGDEDIKVRYPIRFSVGMQQEDFFNFNQGNNRQFRPYFAINLF